jgi:hypothetical protein
MDRGTKGTRKRGNEAVGATQALAVSFPVPLFPVPLISSIPLPLYNPNMSRASSPAAGA